MIAHKTVVIALLAAGLSRRFGENNKLLAVWRGKPLIAHAAEVLSCLPTFRRIAICQPGDAELQSVLNSAGFDIIINAHSEDGLSQSVRMAAQAAIICGADGLLIALGDMPCVTAAHFGALIRGLDDYPIVASRAADGGHNMPPATFSSNAMAGLVSLTGDQGARAIIQSGHAIIAADTELRDFDIPVDFGL